MGINLGHWFGSMDKWHVPVENNRREKSIILNEWRITQDKVGPKDNLVEREDGFNKFANSRGESRIQEW